MGHRDPAPALTRLPPVALGAGAALLLACWCAGRRVAAEPLQEAASWRGENDDDHAAASLAGAGDVDGDGLDDLVIGAPNNDETAADAGQAYLVLGGPAALALDQDLAAADASFLGEAGGDEAGYAVAGVGDVDGDGLDDLAIAAPYNDEGAWDGGQVYLLLGRLGGWAAGTPLSAADASFLGHAGGDHAGAGLAGGGDLDGDGLDDLVIGAPNNDEAAAAAGQVYVVLGRIAGWTMDTPLSLADGSILGEYDLRLGEVLDIAPDLDGDGLDDLVLGSIYADDAGTQSGRVDLIPGMETLTWSQDLTLGEAFASYIGEASYDYAGGSVAGVGDVDGDGLGDVLIGAPGNNEPGGDAGQVYLVTGRTTGWTVDTPLSSADASFWGEDAGDGLGDAVAAAGDVDGDGLGDMLLSAPGSDAAVSGGGRVYLIRGRAGGWLSDEPVGTAADAWLDGDGETDYLGLSLAGAGDIDGDGYDDLLAGTGLDDEAGNDSGEASLVLGYPCGDADGDGFDRCSGGGPIDCDDGDPSIYPGAPDDPCDGIDSDCAGDDELADLDGDGYSPCDGDCDDGDAAVFPGALEVCDGRDDDCDGVTPADEADGDGDGYRGCEGDCDDADPAVHPGAPDVCGDGVDTDCGGNVALEYDTDGDGVSPCDGDCDDVDPTVHPGADDDPCDGIDGDCDGVEELVDLDGDGYTPCDGDCNDMSAAIHPGADELCNGVDDDCDPTTVEDEDLDGDGVPACDDCDDRDATVFPGAREDCNGIDDDCDGIVDEGFDEDGDGYSWCVDGDCDDGDAIVFPGSIEIPYDGIDQDCDGTDLVDVDGDGYPGGTAGTDCDDLRSWIHPGATELCNDDVDGDCDGVLDRDEPDCAGAACACRLASGTAPPLDPWPPAAALLFLGLGWRRRPRPASRSGV